MAGYSGILVVLLATFITLLSIRPDTSILRQPGTIYQTLPNNQYSNIYEIRVINKTFDEIDYELRLQEPEGELVKLGDFSNVPAQRSVDGRFLVKLPSNQLNRSASKTELIFGIYANGKKVETVTSGFIGPSLQGN